MPHVEPCTGKQCSNTCVRWIAFFGYKRTTLSSWWCSAKPGRSTEKDDGRNRCVHIRARACVHVCAFRRVQEMKNRASDISRDHPSHPAAPANSGIKPRAAKLSLGIISSPNDVTGGPWDLQAMNYGMYTGWYHIMAGMQNLVGKAGLWTWWSHSKMSFSQMSSPLLPTLHSECDVLCPKRWQSSLQNPFHTEVVISITLSWFCQGNLAVYTCLNAAEGVWHLFFKYKSETCWFLQLPLLGCFCVQKSRDSTSQASHWESDISSSPKDESWSSVASSSYTSLRRHFCRTVLRDKHGYEDGTLTLPSVTKEAALKQRNVNAILQCWILVLISTS